MAELKTRATKASVKAYIAAIQDPVRKKDCIEVAKLMEAATKAKPVMWGTSIVGFGKKTFRYATGREVEWMIVGFSSRKASLTLYLGLSVGNAELLKKLGKHTTGKGCLYIKSLEEVDRAVLKKLIQVSANKMEGKKVS